MIPWEPIYEVTKGIYAFDVLETADAVTNYLQLTYSGYNNLKVM